MYVMKREYWVLLLITIIALFLRFASILIGFTLQANLDTSIFPDEANFLVGARYFFLGISTSDYFYLHNSLILSPIISGLYIIFGTTAFAGRFLSVCLGTLTIPMTYVLAKELFKNERKALVAALLLSISFIHRFWTIRALADGPLTFFFVISIYLFVKAINSEDWRLYIAAGISTTITILVKYPGILIYAIIFFYLLINIYLKQIPKKVLLYFLITIGIFLLTIISLLLSQFVLAIQPINQITSFLEDLFSFSSNPFYYIFNTIFLNVVWAVILFGIFLIIIVYALKNHSRGDILLISWIGVVFIFFSLYGESELYRYLLPAFPALYLLISHVFLDIFSGKIRFMQNFSRNAKKIAKSLVLIMLIGFMCVELVIGEIKITERSQTYGGIYQCSQWLNANGSTDYGIMCPYFAQSQVEFYTDSDFTYYGLSGATTFSSLMIDLETENVKYIILSEHFPESLSLPINNILPDYPSNFTKVYSYTDGTFLTRLYEVNF